LRALVVSISKNIYLYYKQCLCCLKVIATLYRMSISRKYGVIQTIFIFASS